jgi:hypothetical protein
LAFLQLVRRLLALILLLLLHLLTLLQARTHV